MNALVWVVGCAGGLALGHLSLRYLCGRVLDLTEDEKDSTVGIYYVTLTVPLLPFLFTFSSSGPPSLFQRILECGVLPLAVTPTLFCIVAVAMANLAFQVVDPTHNPDSLPRKGALMAVFAVVGFGTAIVLYEAPWADHATPQQRRPSSALSGSLTRDPLPGSRVHGLSQ